MDPFDSVPVEIRKEILNRLGNCEDVFSTCAASPTMYKASYPLYKQVLESELGYGVISKIFPDALAAVTFPAIDTSTSPEDQKATIIQHLQTWRTRGLPEQSSEADKMRACHFIDRVVYPLAEDYANRTHGTSLPMIHFPHWAHRTHHRIPPIDTYMLAYYLPEVRLRIIRAFCRFEILCKIIRARPGRQLWSMSEQKALLSDFFDAWEVEEILCIHQYVGDMHLLLFKKQQLSVVAKLAQESDKLFHQTVRALRAEGQIASNSVAFYGRIRPWAVGIHRGSLENTATLPAHVKTPFYLTKAGNYDDDEAQPIRKIEFFDEETQSTFLKHLATFGLGFLKHFLEANEIEYHVWVRRYSDTILDTIAAPGEAEYVGANDRETWAGKQDPLGDEREWWQAYQRGEYSSPSSSSSSSSSRTRQGAATRYGRYPGKRDENANQAWRFLNRAAGAAKSKREAYRRCGWVFWDDETLRRLSFWNAEDVTLQPEGSGGDPAPAWSVVLRPRTHYEEVKIARLRRHFGPRLNCAAQMRLLRFGQEINAIARIWRLAAGDLADGASPPDALDRSPVPRAVWDRFLGPAGQPVAADGPVEVFDGIVWG